MPSIFRLVVAVLTFHCSLSLAEQHTIKFENRCGHGTPHLVQKGQILSTGQPFTSNGPFYAGIVYLQTGDCLLNGEHCTIVEMSLINPSCPGCGSSADISLIPPLAFSVAVTFSYFGGCDGQGATCSTGNCSTAFFKPDDNQVQVACQSNDVNLLITFCPGGSGPSPTSLSAASSLPSLKAASNQTEAGTLPPTMIPQSTLTSPAPTSTPTSSIPKCTRRRRVHRRRDAIAPVEGPRWIDHHAQIRRLRRRWW